MSNGARLLATTPRRGGTTKPHKTSSLSTFSLTTIQMTEVRNVRKPKRDREVIAKLSTDSIPETPTESGIPSGDESPDATEGGSGALSDKAPGDGPIPAAIEGGGIPVGIPLMPCNCGAQQVTEEFAVLAVSDAKSTGIYTLDRSQCIKLGSELIKIGNSMPRPKQIEAVSGLVGPDGQPV